MAETIECVHCKTQLRLPEQFIGQDVRCPSCEKTFAAQKPGGSPPAPTVDEVANLPPTPVRSEPPADDSPPKRRQRSDDDEDDYPRSSRPRPDRYDDMRRYAQGDRSGMVLALGIISVVFVLISCVAAGIVGVLPIGVIGIGTGIAAWLIGRKDLAAIASGDRDPNGQGLTNAGMICGIIGTIINGVIVLLQCLVIVVGLVFFLAVAAKGP
jgi:predicted Zn finger-like uncharacterized protein